MTPNVLFICGSLNQTTMMHKIARNLSGYNCFFTPYYADGIEDLAARMGWLGATVLGGRHRRETLAYLAHNGLPLDTRGGKRTYDLVVTCSDLIVQKNIRSSRIVLVQEGITEPERWSYWLVKWFKLPRYLANTAATGLSNAYDLFCVASEGYRDHFIAKGVRPEKIAVTGVPNFDDLTRRCRTDFPLHDYALVVTSPLRESLRYDNRQAFLHKCLNLSKGRRLLFKLHPVEHVQRATQEIQSVIPDAVIYAKGDAIDMIPNAALVITQQSTATFVALALGKEVHTELNLSELKRLMPIQNGGTSAERIAAICQRLLHTPMPLLEQIRKGYRRRPNWDRADSF